MLRKNKKLAIIASTIVSVAVLGLVLKVSGVFDNSASPTRDESSLPGQSRPATDEEKSQSEDAKEKIITKESAANNTPNGNAPSTNPIITSATEEELSAIVTGIIEENGDCIAEYSKGDMKFTRTSKGIQNATNTVCYPIETNASDFTQKGEWSVILTYKSANTSGVSKPFNFMVK